MLQALCTSLNNRCITKVSAMCESELSIFLFPFARHHIRAYDVCVMKVLATMGCTDPSNSSGLHVASSSLAACMIAAGVKPRSDPLLMGLVQAYRAFALKGIQVILPVEAAVPSTTYLHL